VGSPMRLFPDGVRVVGILVWVLKNTILKQHIMCGWSQGLPLLWAA